MACGTTLIACVTLSCSAHRSSASTAHVGPTNEVTTEDVDRLQRGCARRDPYACYAAGQFHREGVGTLVAKDPGAYTSAMDHACDLGSRRACAEHLSKARGHRACMAGVAESCYDFASKIVVGAIHVGQLHRPVDYMYIGCALGDARACGGVSSFTGEPVVMETAQRVASERLSARLMKLRSICEGLNKLACVELATLYERGIVDEGDLSSVEHLLTQACDAGVSTGCAELGKRYRKIGHIEGAVEAYRKGCDLCLDRPPPYGDPQFSHAAESCAALAALYEREGASLGTLAKARVARERACLGGENSVCMEAITGTGESTATYDFEEIQRIQRAACEAGNEVGCQRLRATP